MDWSLIVSNEYVALFAFGGIFWALTLIGIYLFYDSSKK